MYDPGERPVYAFWHVGDQYMRLRRGFICLVREVKDVLRVVDTSHYFFCRSCLKCSIMAYLPPS